MSGSASTRRLTRGISLAAVAAVALTVGVSQGLAKTTVVCGQVITSNTHVGNDLTNCPGDGLVIGANNVKLDLGGHVIDGGNAAGSDGIRNSGGFDNVRVSHGTVQQFGDGVDFSGGANNGKIEHLKVLQNTGRGIGLVSSNGNKISHNKVWSNFDGIHLNASDTNKIDHDEVFTNTASAIVLITGSDGNKVEHNKTHDNPSWGITSDDSVNNTYKHNKVANNHIAGIGVFRGTNLRIDHNDLSGNMIGIELFTVSSSFVTKNKIRSSAGDGVFTHVGSTANLLRDNHTDENGADGIDVADVNAGNTIAHNHANKNTNLGIFAAAGNTDGGGNKAKDNGNPLQCVGVTCKK